MRIARARSAELYYGIALQALEFQIFAAQAAHAVITAFEPCNRGLDEQQFAAPLLVRRLAEHGY